VKRWQRVLESPVCHERSSASCGASPAFGHLLLMTASKTGHGASRGHGRNPVLGERPPDGGGTPTGAVVASRFIQGHDGPCDVCWRVGRVALGSGGPCLGPSGMRCLRALPPLREPTFRAGQVPTEVLALVSSTRGVHGLLTAWCLALGQEGCLWERMVDVPMDPVFSMAWHHGCRVSGAIGTLMMDRRCTRQTWRRQRRSKQEPASVSHQPSGAGRTTETLRGVQRRRV
jgi:hypothetical protein